MGNKILSNKRSVCVTVVPGTLQCAVVHSFGFLLLRLLFIQGFLNLNSLDLFGAPLTHSLCL